MSISLPLPARSTLPGKMGPFRGIRVVEQETYFLPKLGDMMRKKDCKRRATKLGHILMALPGVLLELLLFGSTAAEDDGLDHDLPSSGPAPPEKPLPSRS